MKLTPLTGCGGRGVCVHVAQWRESGVAGAELCPAEGVGVWGRDYADEFESETDGIDE